MSARILTDLPLEIFLLIAENLRCEKDINALSQVNRGLYNLLTPYLYRMDIRNSCNPAIAWVAFYGQEGTVRKALEQGASAAYTQDDDTPQPICGHVHIVRLLPNNGFPMSLWQNDDDGRMPRFILDWYYAGLRLRPMRDWPPWTAALATGHDDVLQVLIEEGGFVPRARDLFNTAIDGYFETLKVLVRGCRRSMDLADPEFTAVLGVAIHASSDNLDIARFMIDSGSPVNCMDNDQHTPLAYAADSGNVETVKLLLDRGADPDPETPHGR
ncbi:hypothetical protein PENCOP_c006G08747 [Penicillium coprophilum]|uniref:Uncharacterized protein n=1 Tax=Penicillium coprophilum TaxID=36646 RepID=A0A1V6UN77_9EURO|nr:hypothetical protein PENCOP_c006G08747 [Penicillium coprophilum]